LEPFILMPASRWPLLLFSHLMLRDTRYRPVVCAVRRELLELVL
jgi:hypothetical protein